MNEIFLGRVESHCKFCRVRILAFASLEEFRGSCISTDAEQSNHNRFFLIYDEIAIQISETNSKI